MNNKLHKTAFLKAVKEHDLSVYFHRNDHYILIKGGDSSRIISVQLICSLGVDEQIHGSHNGNITSGIGRFKFTIPKWTDKINFYIFGFSNSENESEFVCIPDEILRSRFQKLKRITDGGKTEMTLWLFSDRKVYDCTNISMEGEWYYLSKGVNGRMMNSTEWDYSEYLNNWGVLTNIL